MRKLLEYQSDRIEAVLAVHRVPARVTGGTVTPRWVRFEVLPAVGARISRIKGLGEELAAALDAPAVRVSRRGAAVAVEVPRDNPRPVRLLPLIRQIEEGGEEIPPLSAILGLAEDGAPLLIRLPSPDVAHVLVAGTTGSGKTVLLQAMILSLALRNPARDLALAIAGPRDKFEVFTGLPHLARFVRDAGEAPELLRSLVRLVELRDREQVRKPAVVLVVDELADLLMTGGEPVQAALTRLVQRGREAGIHVIAATQKPTAAVLGPLVKANFPVRLVGRVTSIEDARTAAGWGGTGAERLLGRGDFLAVAGGRTIRFQGAHVSPEEIREVLTRLDWAPKPGMRAAVEPEPVKVEVVLPEVPEPPDPVDELVERLRAMGWDANRPYLQACQALGEAPGGGPFFKVREAVNRMRKDTTTMNGEDGNSRFPDSGCIFSW